MEENAVKKGNDGRGENCRAIFKKEKKKGRITI